MRFREPLLGGSAAMPGASLQRACRLLVAICALHLGVTLVYYLSGRDLTRLPQLMGVSSPLRGGAGGAANLGQPSGELRPRGAPPPLPSDSASKPHPDRRPTINWTAAPEPHSTALPLPTCPEESPLLVGPMMIEFNMPVDLDRVARQNPKVKVGGRYAPTDCVSPHKVAVIIPFRNRQEHLRYWLYYLHPILQRQQLDYGIYVINQDGDSMFNRAKLLNVGFKEALKDYDYNCFVFSDVDLIPMDDHNAYRCFPQPRHISVAMDKFGFRLVFKGMSISRPSAVVGKCRMIRHSRDKKNEPNPQRFDRIAHTKETMLLDGLNTLSYKVLAVERSPLYTKITVDVGKPS
ncbi:beta-1,4-galactosyltransferase 1 isoform X2 [Echinops telfairi]|uniref:Beta-1,4-galactosyltransferase 1 isoform X2 n=1 Tax=Echinops telfairi TaxID=9371 RepID=A0AC55D0A4_ECHTE|nr:beta-1,4-galactosyltransferase 1 isoform X2 [Echinops telfairi]